MDLNFVSEIVSVASETELKGLHDAIQTVSEKASLLKINVKDQLGENYQRILLPRTKENTNVVNQVTQLVQEIKELNLRLETQTKRDVEDLAEELKTMKESLIEASTLVDTASKLTQIDNNLKKAKAKADSKEYYSAAKHINSASKYLNQECKDLDFLDTYKGLTETLAFYHEEYCREALENWNKCIKWTHVEDLENERLYTSLSISEDKAFLENLLKTLELFESSNKEIASFGDNLLTKFLLPVIRTESFLVNLKSGELNISSSPQGNKPHYNNVLDNLNRIFNFIDATLSIKLHDSSFISNLGEYIAEDFLNFLINECLTDAIPSKREHAENCAPVLESMKKFQGHLIAIGFLPASNKLLDDYFVDNDTLFLNKTLERHLETAMTFMKANLHDTMQVGTEPLRDDNTRTKVEQSTDKSLTFDGVSFSVNELGPNFFQFPKCLISKSVDDLFNHISAILTEAMDSDRSTCLELFRLSRHILELYYDIVSMYHANVLEDIPQYAAILHNNLMYLAHHTMTLEFDKKPYKSAGRTQPVSCLIDLVAPLRKEAANALLSQVSAQEKILLNMVKECGLTTISEYEELPEITEKSIKRCLKQLSLLKSVWMEVLPVNIYVETIGNLCNTVVKEVTDRIVVTTDIRANIATSLVKVLSLIETEVPPLFTDQVHVYQNVKCWNRFRELIRMLGASLADVGERWADGKGPLAAEFTADQVRQMVKALFQVSDRRAAVLSVIK